MNRRSFKWSILFMSMLAMFSFSSCSDDDVPNKTEQEENGDGEETVEPLAERMVTLSRKTSYGNDWIYFSLSEGKELAGIDETNRESNLKWDLAFNRYNVRTNSGVSGKGQGGAMDAGKKELKDVTVVPEGEFVVDEMAKITSKFTGTGVEEIESPLNKKLGEAIKFAGPPPTYTPSEHVYIVKTADGKYAKVKVLSFYNDEGKSGYVQFSYVYQPNGSKNFK